MSKWIKGNIWFIYHVILCFWLCLSWPVIVYAVDQEAPAVVVEGLSGKALDNVKATLVLPPGFIEKGKIDETLAERFAEQAPHLVREALMPFGYYEPDVTAIWEKTGENDRRLLVRVREGDPIRLGVVHVKIEGAGKNEPALLALVAAFPLRTGDIMRQDIYEQAKEALLQKTIALGYGAAMFSTHEIRVARMKKTAEIDLILATGIQYRFGAVSFTGKPAYPDAFLRRYLEFKAGDIFSPDKMALTQANFANADRFREINVHAGLDKAVDGQVPVDIALTPAPAKSVKAGVGYGTDTGPRATMRYRDMNVLSLGQDFDTEIKVSKVLQSLSAKYTFPSTRDARSYTGLTAGLQREDTTSYVSQLVKIEAEQVYGFAKTGTISAFIQARKENSDAGDQSTNTFLLMPGGRLSDQRYDDVIRPRKGFQYQLELRGTHQSLGSSTGFIQILSSGDWIIPLLWDLSLTTRARLGATWQNDPVEDLPVSVRFFAGGDRSIRGYAYQSLGPKDSSGNVVGGRNLLTGTVELERHIGRDWGIAAFYDAGNAFNNLSDFSAAQGAGLGVRYYSPIGPIKVDVARQINVVEPDIRIHLTIGVGL
ncbi:MAG: Translocation and assembly module subunit TamA [Syntrophus sp. SKADARSKE-3]|nr:Translocation and assembly module subunit TamA [Syntrophus sp. SKADARSKE-3]